MKLAKECVFHRRVLATHTTMGGEGQMDAFLGDAPSQAPRADARLARTDNPTEYAGS